MIIEQFFIKVKQLVLKIFWIIVGLAGIVGSIYCVSTFYGSTEKSPNQSAGVTDNTLLQTNSVNTESGKRRISQEQLKILVPAMKKVCSNTIEIAYAIGDPEQKQFAEDIINAFHSAGCNPEIPQPPTKLIMQGFGQKGLSFGLNINPPYPSGSEELSQAFNEIGIESKWIGFHDFPRNFLLVYVGERP